MPTPAAHPNRRSRLMHPKHLSRPKPRGASRAMATLAAIRAATATGLRAIARASSRNCSTRVSSVIRILVDADACPVKDEVYRVAFRRGIAVKVISNMRMRIPDHPLVERVLVSGAFDAADD